MNGYVEPIDELASGVDDTIMLDMPELVVGAASVLDIAITILESISELVGGVADAIMLAM